MPSLKTAVVATTTTTTTIALKPALKKKLMTALKTYAELAEQKRAIKLAMEKQSKAVEAIQVDLGESHLDIDGYKSTLVAPMKLSKGWKKRYVALGGELAILEQAQAESKVPGKSYVKITPPGAKDEDDDDDE